ncbi:MAG: translation initiation factor IF-2 [Lentimonas sp.]|jgi:translation initiation factor IF-2
MAVKPTRLGKASASFNVGLSTLVEFLESKGSPIDPNPNTKLTSEQYDFLMTEYAADQSLKEKTKQAAPAREKRETISLRDQREEEAPIEEETPEPTPAPAPTPVAPPDPIVVEKPAPATTPEPVIETPKPVEAKKEEPIAEKKEEEKPATNPSIEEANSGDVKVIGKIDLDKLNTKTRPDKKSAEEKKKERSDKSKSTPAPAPASPRPPVATKPAAPEEKPAEAPGKEAPKAIETFRAESKKLTGPTVLGKIILPVEKPRSSGKPGDHADRKKRKRIKKIDPAKAGPNTGNNTPNRGGPGGPGNRRVDTRINKGPKPEITEKDIQKEIKDTLARLSSKGGKSKASKIRRAKRDRNAQEREAEAMHQEMEEKVLKLTEFVSVSELATMMDVQSTQVIGACMSLGIFASINQRLDAETIQIVAEEFGFEIEFVSAEVQDAIQVIEDKEEDLVTRPPIITVMGHVDHGKTSLLDRIRNANVIDGEAGGITQHIGAYSVELKNERRLTFLDTPGHEAFTAMRARGAQITDVAIIILAADDDLMPQSKEAISHAQAANVPMVFAINKIDKPGASPDRIREQLSNMNILVEDWGGTFQCQEISAKMGTNIDELLEKVLLEADLLELRANPDKNALGTVIESSLDKGKGYVTNMLVEAGTLKVGDIVLVGRNYGRVRAMHDEHGQSLKVALPSQPVSILGINGAPSAGDKFNVLNDEREARTIATKREQLYREQGLRTTKHITLDEIGRRLAIGDFQELNLIVKGDVDGSIEALSDSLLNLSTEQIAIKVVHKGVGAISEADVNLASASDAIIIGFQVRPTVGARKLAETEEIDIRLYSVIYKAIEEIKAAMEGMLSPEIEEKILGSAEVREAFNISKVGTIAGCYVTEGIIKRNSKIRVIRDGIVIHSGLLGSLKRFKDDVKEVKNNYECGLNVDKFNDIIEGDIIEAFEEVEVARKL